MENIGKDPAENGWRSFAGKEENALLKKDMNFRDIENYILEIPKFTKKNKMEDTLKFYEYLGCPGSELKIIHVAGTNGKGSVCAFLENMLLKTGHSCGLFTSPHLISMRERMRIGKVDISKEDFVRIFYKLMEKCQNYGNYEPTFFELLFFMAVLWFQEKKPEYIILETGLGGRLDTTNVVKKKELCVITKIALDHTEYLGETLSEIAKEKAGIIRSGVPVVYYHKEDASASSILERAKSLGADTVAFHDTMIQNPKKHEKFIDFSIFFEYYGYSDITVSSIGVYQMSNAGLAILAGQKLLGKELTPQLAGEAIRETRWPCRMEEVLPGIYIDGAHNPDGMEAFLESVSNSWQKKILLFSVVSDKDYEEMLDRLTRDCLFEEIIITTIGGSRAIDPDKLTTILRQRFRGKIVVETDAVSAFRYALGVREGRLLFVAGSLYLAGLVKGLCEEEFK